MKSLSPAGLSVECSSPRLAWPILVGMDFCSNKFLKVLIRFSLSFNSFVVRRGSPGRPLTTPGARNAQTPSLLRSLLAPGAWEAVAKWLRAPSSAVFALWPFRRYLNISFSKLGRNQPEWDQVWFRNGTVFGVRLGSVWDLRLIKYCFKAEKVAWPYQR